MFVFGAFSFSFSESKRLAFELSEPSAIFIGNYLVRFYWENEGDLIGFGFGFGLKGFIGWVGKDLIFFIRVCSLLGI